MVLIDFDTDLIDIPKFFDTKSEIFLEISRNISDFRQHTHPYPLTPTFPPPQVQVYFPRVHEMVI